MNNLISILNGAIITDIIIILMNHFDIIFISQMLKRWYREFRLSAMLMDVIIITLYVLGGQYLLKKLGMGATLVNTILAAIAVQVVGDILFYKFYSAIPRGASHVFDFFKDYTKEIGAHALWADAVMMALTVLLASYFKKMSPDRNMINLLIVFYVGQYALYTGK